MKRFGKLALALAVMLPLLAAPKPVDAAPYLYGVGYVGVSPGGVAVSLTLPGRAGTPYRVQWLTNPYRVVVDLQGAWLGTASAQSWVGTSLVTQIRAARHANGITRIVFDLNAPADLRADNRGGALVLTVGPRAIAAVAPPAYVAAPPVAPVVPYARMAPYGYPVARITPIPVLPPIGWMPPAGPMQPYQPTPMQTQPPMVVQPYSPSMTPPPVVQTPYPMVSAPPFQPEPDEQAYPDLAPPGLPRSLFGGRFYVEPGAALSVGETYTAGNSNTSVGLTPLVGGGLDMMFTQMIGMSLGVEALGYKVEDSTAKASGVNLVSARDELDGHLGLRLNFALPANFELMAQPQIVVMNRGVNATLNGTATTALPGFMTTGFLGYGGGLGLGVGYRVFDWMGIKVGGEFNYLLGSMSNAAITNVLPMTNIKAGGDLQFELGAFGINAGYKFVTYSGAGNYGYTWNGPAVGLAYLF